MWFRRKEQGPTRVETSPWIPIEEHIEELLLEARNRRTAVVSDFNGVDVVVHPNSTHEEAMAQYRQGRETRDLEQRVRQSIPKALAISDLLDEFHKLHLIDRELLLNWLVRFGQAWHVGTTVDSRAIARRLLETGLYNEIRVPEGIPNNRQEHADLLIGQAIAWLQDGRGFEEVFPTVVERWRDRW